ncbi:nucleotidyltransferase domain-containing protein [Haloarchaeobius amylolyticus]|uniref:nucleotidyltransferase domain-containing protein n=1 Tax=Haloarchaeobius amylolyticus TaxID=1198296 RepID=UPI00227173FB|nr:nucleotidyltransferase domain-containing protein [Haloarchaeobius amylolyticus]
MTTAPPSLAAAIDELEATHDCTVLAARDVGSRAWGLASEDSDYDVAVLFRQSPVRYATLGEYVPSVETEHGPDLELTGWNVRRFGELLADSNPSTLEFLHSPLRYRECDALARLEADVAGDFRPIRLYHHYRSLAEHQYRKYIERRVLRDGEPALVVTDETDTHWVGEPVGDGPSKVPKADDRYAEGTCDQTVKRTLYVIRAVLYARYVRDTHAFPALDFPSFLDECEADGREDPSVLARARDLVARKRAGEGDVVVGQVFTPDEVALPEEIPPAEHAVRGIATARVNRFVEETFEL